MAGGSGACIHLPGATGFCGNQPVGQRCCQLASVIPAATIANNDLMSTLSKCLQRLQGGFYMLGFIQAGDNNGNVHYSLKAPPQLEPCPAVQP